MSVPRISCVMSSYLPQAEKGVDFTICLCLASLLLIAARTRGLSYVMSFYLSRAEQGVGFSDVCTWHAVLPLTARCKWDGFHTCVYLAFPLSYLPTYHQVKEGWFSHMPVPPALSVACLPTY